MSNVKEIVSLIRDLDLVPRNYEASVFFDIVELEDLSRNRIMCDLRALSYRNSRKRKPNPYVLAPDNNQLSLPFES